MVYTKNQFQDSFLRGSQYKIQNNKSHPSKTFLGWGKKMELVRIKSGMFKSLKQKQPTPAWRSHYLRRYSKKLRRDSFNKRVDQLESNKHSKGNDAWSHFVTMVFCQFSKSDSLNDVCDGMRSETGDLNHLGVTKAMKRSSLLITISIEAGSYFKRCILICMISLNQL